MNIEDFIANFAELFDETDVGEIKADTKFKQMREWTSLIALSVMAMVDAEYDVQLKGNDFRDCNTVLDLYNKVLAYKG